MILEKIKNDLREAMKSRNEIVVSTLRFLISALQNKAIEKQKDLTDEDVVQVIARQVKERKESIEAFRAGNREDLVKKEQAELEILNKYLPQQLSEEELGKIVKETIDELGVKDSSGFGLVMKTVMGKIKGQADGSTVSESVKKFLS